ncbi:hypothetical protein Q669_31990 [Labrenzia sp. C1B10]|uniref:chemotaxis protein CheB n=1 Tax=unclassified Labrenzia TaxID=2648686 RepID=UPI0003B8BF6C|nr:MULTISPECIES: chemotaxis protein CheB [unclassified Labrenzia]ERP91222.1 hypothetical protein Q669_31990 [Labrenzia sp. C1B10]ERS04181.1 hypothetical protein Q675_30800 [Labrenzia sp. C1B70]
MMAAPGEPQLYQDDQAPIRLLICDDSIFMRMAIKTICEEISGVEVVAEAENGQEVIDAVRVYKPDVITMDVDMPGVDGISATATIRSESDVPVIVVSGLTERRGHLAKRMLEVGAVDVIWKSGSLMDIDISGIAQTIVDKVLFWGARAPVLNAIKPAGIQSVAQGYDIIHLSAGTGAPQSVNAVLGPLPGDYPPLVVTADIPSSCMEGFSRQLEKRTGLSLREPQENTVLERGCIYVLHGDSRLSVTALGDSFRVMRENQPRAGEKQSCSWRMHANLAIAAKNPLMIVLSGAVADPRGLKLAMKNQCDIWIQKRDSCVDASGCEAAVKAISAARELSPSSISGLLGVS